MTSFTLMTVAALGLALVSLLASSVLVCALLYSVRRLQTPEAMATKLLAVAGDLSLLRKEYRNLDEIFESYRKRDANRVSQAVQRTKKAEAQQETPDFDADTFRLTGGVQ
jgi:hypothetical protein